MFDENEGEGEETETEVEETEAEADPKAGEVADPKAADPKGAAEPPPKSALDELMETDWLKEQIELAGDKELPVTEEEIKNLDPAAQRVIANIVLRGRTGAAAALTAQQQAQQREADLSARERLLLARQSEALRFFKSPKLQAFLDEAKPKGDRPDPDSPEGRDYDARERFSALMDGFFSKLSEIEEEATKTAAESEEAARTEAQRTKDTAYVQQHLDDFKDPETYALIENHVKHGYGLEEAHKLAMKQIIADSVDKDKAAELATSRRRVQPGRRTRNAIPETPKGLTASALNDWYDKHPDAMARDLADFERKGVGF
jgi:hypothetical protein